LERGGERLVKIRQKTEEGVEEVEKVIKKEHVASLVGKEQGRGRSGSPKKRRPETNLALEEPISMERQCHEWRTSSTSSSSTTFPDLSHGSSVEGELSEPCRTSFGISKRLALKSQRPGDPSLICCDYTSTEEANALGLDGQPEFGGGHLCMYCLGAEVKDDLDIE